MSEELMDTQPIPVHVTNPDQIVFRTEEREPENFVFTTLLLVPPATLANAGQSPQQILSLDPLRKDASAYSPDGPWVLCHSAGQASSAANQVANFPAPDGAYIQQGQPVSLTGTGPAWACCQTPIRLVLAINKRQK